MPLLFRDGPLEIAVESMEAAPAWCGARRACSRQLAFCDVHANSRQLCRNAGTSTMHKLHPLALMQPRVQNLGLGRMSAAVMWRAPGAVA